MAWWPYGLLVGPGHGRFPDIGGGGVKAVCPWNPSSDVNRGKIDKGVRAQLSVASLLFWHLRMH